METENFSEQNSLQFIQSMINRAKNKFTENGTLYLLWGFTVLLCCLLQFVLSYFFKYAQSYIVWSLTWLAVIYQLIYLSRRKKNLHVKTYTEEIMNFVWLTFIFSLFLIVFILWYYQLLYCINPLLLVLYGIPTFLSGIILKFRPLIVGGVCCWVFAVFSVFVDNAFHSVFIAAAVIIAWIIPGYMLRTRFYKENE